MRPTLLMICLLGMIAALSLVVILVSESLAPYTGVLAGVLLVVFFLDALRSWPGEQFAVRFRLPKSLFVGAQDYMEIEVSTPESWPSLMARVAVECSPLLNPVDRHDFRLEPDSRNLVKLDLVPRRRGRASVERLWLRWNGPLGLASWTRTIPVEQKIAVLPDIRAVSRDALKFSARDALFGIKPQWQQGDGSEFDALREYIPGLDSRSIDWKSTARHKKLICKEFQTERNHQIILAYDTGHLMMEEVDGLPKLDHAIKAGLLLSYLSLRNGDRVGLIGYDAKVRHYQGPVGGTQNFNRLQEVCARLDYHTEETNYTLAMVELMSRLNRRSLIILLTDFADTVTSELMIDNIRRLARRHLVIFVALRDREITDLANRSCENFEELTTRVIANDFLQERQIVLEKLARLGVQCVDTTVENLGVDLLNKYIHVTQREMI